MTALRAETDRKPMDPQTLRRAADVLRAAAEAFDVAAARGGCQDAVTDNAYEVLDAIACVTPGPDGEHLADTVLRMND